MSDYLKKRKKNQSKKFKGKDFSLKMKKHDDVSEVVHFNPLEDVGGVPEDFVKIGKYWDQSCLIEPKNTSGKLFFIEDMNMILSQVENELFILNQNDLSLIKKISEREESLVSFTFNPKKKEIICSMSNSLVRVYNIENLNKCNHVWKLNKEVAKIMKLDFSFKFLAIATSTNKILVYDMDNYKLLCTFSEHTGFIYDIQFNPDREKFILYSASEDGTVKVWDLLLNKCIKSLGGHSNSVRHICLTNDGRSLISITLDNNIYVWKLGNKIEDISLLKTYKCDGDISSVIYFTRDKNDSENFNIKKELIPSLLLGFEDGTLCEFNLKTGILDNEQSLSLNHQPIFQIFYSSINHRLFLLTADQTIIDLQINIVKLNISNSKLNKMYPGYCQEILDIKFLKPKNSEMTNSIKLPKFLFSSNENNLKYYNKISEDKFQIKSFEGHSDFIMHIETKGDYVSTSSKDGTIRIWKYKGSLDSVNFYNDFDLECIALIKGHSEGINSSCLLIKSSNLRCISVSKDKTIKLWNIGNSSNFQIINESLKSEMTHSEEINVVKVSPNEKVVASGSFDKTIKIYNSELKVIGTLQGHKRAITDLNFSQYAKLLASSSTDKTIKIWNLNDLSCINTFEGHLASVLKIQWVYCGTHILSSGADGLVKLWNFKTSECLNTINSNEGKIWALDVIDSTDAESNFCQFITGGTDSKIFLWTDITAEKEKENLQKEEEKILKKEKLRLLNQNKNFYEGMKLALDLNHKNEFLVLFKNYFEEIYKNKNGQSQKDYNNINVIIDNRKVLDESDENFTTQDVVVSLNKTLENVMNDSQLKNIVTQNLDKILEISRDFNVKSNSFLHAQILLKFILVNFRPQLFEKENVSLGKKNKKIKRRSDINYMDNFTIIKSYSEKHLERINREIVKSYLIEFVLEKMKII